MKKSIALDNSKRTNAVGGCAKPQNGLFKWLKTKVTEKLKVFREEDPKIYPHF